MTRMVSEKVCKKCQDIRTGTYCRTCGTLLEIANRAEQQYSSLWELMNDNVESWNEPFYAISEKESVILAAGNWRSRANGVYPVDSVIVNEMYPIVPEDITNKIKEFEESYKPELDALRINEQVESVQVLFGTTVYYW